MLGYFDLNKGMTASRLVLVIALTIGLHAAPLVAEAQPRAGKVYRVGLLYEALRVADLLRVQNQPFFLALSELGYTEGQNLIVEVRSAEGRLERVPEIVAELVHLRVDVIVVSTSPVAHRVKQATSTVPIVITSGTTLAELGLVQSLARPGGNVTGLTMNAGPEIETKRLELLREVAPRISRVAFVGSKADWESPMGQAVQRGGRALGLRLVLAEHPASVTRRDYEAALAVVTRERADALFVASGGPGFAYAQLLVEFAAKNRLPAVTTYRAFPVGGGLMSYGPSLVDLYRRAAGYVDKILKGAKPADLPIEQPIKFELYINLKTARSIGLTIPPAVLARADTIIE
jgi:putative tryptophan/tyrosine transport system substrate-binding protein